MNFHKGRPRHHSFFFEGAEIENVKEFKYLGFHLSPQLSWTNHLKKMISKARARIGYMFANLPLRDIPLDMVLNLFKIYIRVAQMAKKCRTYWDQCFSHLFYLVLLENGQKSAEKGHLTPPFWPPLIGLIYSGDKA